MDRRAAAEALGVSVDDIEFLIYLGLIRRSGQVIHEDGVVQLAQRHSDLPELIATERQALGAQLLQPDDVPDRAQIISSSAGWGQLTWFRDVYFPVSEQVCDDLNHIGALTRPDVGGLLVPPELRRPLNDLAVHEYLMLVALFVGKNGLDLAVEKTWEAAARPIGRAIKDSAARHRLWTNAKGFWFLYSVWLADRQLWLVVAVEVPPAEVADVTELILRSQRKALRSASAQNGAGGRALLVRCAPPRTIGRVRAFDTHDDAVRHLGRVHVLATGGPLEVIYDTKHPRSRTALQVCKLLQERAGKPVPLHFLERASQTSRTTVRKVIDRLAAAGAAVSIQRSSHGPVARYDP